MDLVCVLFRGVVCRSEAPDDEERALKVKKRNCRRSVEHGYSLVEMLIVVAAILIIAAVSVPLLLYAMDGVQLRAAATNYAGLLQSARTRAVEQNRFYSVLTANVGGAPIAYVDTIPQNANGTSGNAAYDSGEPLVALAGRVVIDNVHAPAQLNLHDQVVPPASGVALTAAMPSTVTFSSRGLPCSPAAGAGPGTSTCIARSATPVAYATYFSSPRGSWEAVTVTPAGRIQTWLYDGAAWNKL